MEMEMDERVVEPASPPLPRPMEGEIRPDFWYVQLLLFPKQNVSSYPLTGPMRENPSVLP